MTVIVGCNLFDEILLIGDSRISWPDGRIPPRDAIRKLYPYRIQNRVIAIGFCGNVWAASQILAFVFHKKLRRYRRPLVMEQLSQEMVGWIEEVSVARLTPEHRKNTTFMLCGLEASRREPIYKDEQIIDYIVRHNPRICLFSIASNGKVSARWARTNPEVIGTGKAIEAEIKHTIHDVFRLNVFIQSRQIQPAQVKIIGMELIRAITTNTKINKTVGGPFELLRLTSESAVSQFALPSYPGPADTEIRREGERIIFSNSLANESTTLYPIWEHALIEPQAAASPIYA